MKRQFVANLQEGDTINDYFLAVRKDLRDQSNGGKFLGMVFKDRTGEVGGILWNNAQPVSRLFEVGDVVNVRGVVSSYQSRLQIRVDQVLPLKESEFDVADLIDSPQDTAKVLAEFRAMFDLIQDPWLAKLVRAFLDDGVFMDRFASAAAGKRWHHACPGGLIRHCYEVARLALCVCEIYPVVNRDLVLAVVLLHDIGKLEEMSQDLLVDYTDAGKLLGHIQIGCDMVRRRIDAIPDFPEDLRLRIVHCLLAHHGELQNGSPVVPKTLEAFVLFHCDNLSAQIDSTARIIQETRDKGQQWSDFIPLIDRQIWAK